MLGFIFNSLIILKIKDRTSSLFIVVFCIMATKFAVSYRIKCSIISGTRTKVVPKKYYAVTWRKRKFPK